MVLLPLLWLNLVVNLPVPPVTDVSLSARFLKRAELPDDFRFPVLELNFQVVQVTIQNVSQGVWAVPESVLVHDPKNKPIRQVSPAEMTPKIVKSKVFRARQRSAERGPLENIPIYPNPGNYRPYPQGRASGPAMISVDAVEGVRRTLEKHQLAARELQPGEQLEALIYVKSKKNAGELRGSLLVLGQLKARIE